MCLSKIIYLLVISAATVKDVANAIDGWHVD